MLQVCAGFSHTVCVTADGAAFAFGSNSFGQLGLGDTKGGDVPTLLGEELENKSVVQVAAGGGHSVFVTADGLVFACGYNHFENRLVPTLVTEQLQGKAAVYAAAGGQHTLCITTDGSLFGWGSNHFGQLGVGDKKI